MQQAHVYAADQGLQLQNETVRERWPLALTHAAVFNL
jgi:hypothetical protein